MQTLEEKTPLMSLISMKWKSCQTPRDWQDMQFYLDGIWSALVFQGEKAASEDATFLTDVAFELQYFTH
jgi:hypothetical protein